MEMSTVNTIAKQMKARLEKEGIEGTVRIVDNHTEMKYNTGHWLELKAVKVVNGNPFQFTGMFNFLEAQRIGPSALSGSFCAQAIHALAKIDVK
jgi:hypothetical protein